MNFDFLKDRFLFKQLYSFCKDSEEFVISHPDISAISSRKALESVIKTFYTSKYGGYNESASLFDLVQDAEFSSSVGESLLSSIHLIRQLGNNAAHGETVSKAEAMSSLEALYYVVNGLMVLLGIHKYFPKFDKSVYTKSEEEPNKTVQDISGTEIKVETGDLPQIPANNGKTIQSGVDFTEKETRKVYIDTALKAAGWSVSTTDGAILPNTACVEIPLGGMPNNAGVGYADYVLFDNDGKPLAVVEAKKTSVDLNVGAQQAKLYADCIEAKWGVRPVIFYTNGYVINMVDGAGYPARRVFGYYNKNELHDLIIRRDLKSITDTRIDPNISDRYFIQEACTAVCETYNELHRKALVVMATGTGKTRCSISIVDVLQRSNWANRILFLADRKELVNQAFNAFKNFLPNSTRCAISDASDKDKDYNAKVILSTYQTMMGLIDGEQKAFGVGRFDLIILDECHRSVYNKYRGIINYFDSLVLGLTATPREQVDASTYDLFDMPEKAPTYNYDFQTAVNEGFLVNYAPYDCGSKFMECGIKYDELSPSEQEEFDRTFEGTEFANKKVIDKKAFEQFIFNYGTIDAEIQTLMNEGLRINGGEKLGKSIIFAYNHDHAQAIVDRFKVLYPKYGDTYCQLIDYSVNYVGTRISDFKDPNKEPTIAVSVDMLDTGIDVPEVLNLMFFKKVFSSIKFWQMIGRGTRVCKELNVFSPAKDYFEKEDCLDDTKQNFEDKQGFYIFDVCKNFDFFRMHPKGRDGKPSLTLSQKIFELKTELVFELQKHEHQENEEHKVFYDKWKTEVLSLVQNLDRNHVNVQYNLQYVDKYSSEKAWDYIGILDLKEIKDKISFLIESEDGSTSAKRFDVWLFNMELAELIGEDDYSSAISAVVCVCQILLDMTNIPKIALRKELLQEIVKESYWKDITVSKLEEIRTGVRDLIELLPKPDVLIFETNFKDYVKPKKIGGLIPQFKNYKQRVIDYLAENSESDVIKKIRNVEPLSQNDILELERILWQELGTKEDFDGISNGESLGVFVRKIVGLDRDAISKIFAEFLTKYNYNSKQEEFLHQIVTFVLENGDIEPNNLMDDDPFKHLNFVSIFNGHPEAVFELINMLHNSISVAA